MENRSDEQVLQGSLSDPALFEEIVSRYERPFVRKAISILRDEDDAYDAVQEAFVRIYLSGKKFKKMDGASFSSWAYRILVNRCYTSYKKRQSRRVLSLDREEEAIESIPDEAAKDALDRRFTTEYVMSLISRLPAFLGRAVRSHFIEGKSQKEIAEEEGVSHSVIRQRIYRAKKELKKMNLMFAFAPAGTATIRRNK